MSGVYQSDFGPVPLPDGAPDMSSAVGREYARFIEAEVQRFYVSARTGLPERAPSYQEFKEWKRFKKGGKR